MTRVPEMTAGLMPRKGAARPMGEGALNGESVPQDPPEVPPVLTPLPPESAAPKPLPSPITAVPSVPPRRAPLKEGVQPVTVRFRPELHRQLREIAFFEDTSIAAIVEEAVKDWLSRRPPNDS